jgi:erythrocyte band 7 integral membrane protein
LKFSIIIIIIACHAQVIAANGEFDAAQSLKTAADIITQSPAALQLRYLQTLNSISSEKNSTIIFPVPIECLGLFFDRNSPNKRPLPQ